MTERLLFDSEHFTFTVKRLCYQLIERHGDFSESVLIGLQPRGIYLANRLHSELFKLGIKELPLGYLDITFHRDDFRRRTTPLRPNETKIDFLIEKKKVVLIDDVLYTGRSVRAALDAIISFGRPSKVELLVLIDRLYSRDIPVESNYVGQKVNTLASQRIKVAWKEQEGSDSIWIVNKEEE